MQDIFIRIIFGVLVLSTVLKFYEATKKILDEVHFVIAFLFIVIVLVACYFAGGLLIK